MAELPPDPDSERGADDDPPQWAPVEKLYRDNSTEARRAAAWILGSLLDPEIEDVIHDAIVKAVEIFHTLRERPLRNIGTKSHAKPLYCWSQWVFGCQVWCGQSSSGVIRQPWSASQSCSTVGRCWLSRCFSELSGGESSALFGALWGVSSEGAVHRRPADGEQLGEVGDRVVTGVAHAAQFGLLLGG
jgi:hypothetical protein